MASIADILKKYKTRDKFVDRSKTTALEAEITNAIDSDGVSLSDFKKIVKFLNGNDFDDSSTGMVYLYNALNNLLEDILGDPKTKAKTWPWIKENCFTDDRLLKTILAAYTDEAYREEVKELLEGKHSGWLNFDYYYKALYMQLTEDPGFEDYLNAHLDTSDMIGLKMELLLAKGEKQMAFDLIKNESDFVLEAAELTENKEQFLLAWVLDGTARYVGQKESWWNKLKEIAGDKYLPDILASTYLCGLANQELYKAGRYEELMERISTGWIDDDHFGELSDDEASKYRAVQEYKKLKKLYPEWSGQIMIDYAVFMIGKRANRSTYHISANTLVRAGKLSEECHEMAAKACRDLAARYPERPALLQELRFTGLL